MKGPEKPGVSLKPLWSLRMCVKDSVAPILVQGVFVQPVPLGPRGQEPQEWEGQQKDKDPALVAVAAVAWDQALVEALAEH